MAGTINPQDISNAKVDIEDIGESVNEAKVIKPRYGDSYKSIPLVSAEAEAKISEFQQAIDTIVIDDGVPAIAVSTQSDQTQQEINDFGGYAKYKEGRVYAKNQYVMLDNGEVVKAADDGVTNDPNVDMSAWVRVNSAGQIVDESGKTQQEINDYFETHAIAQYDVSKTINVGDGFEYENISDAISYASKFKPKFINSNLKIKIQLKSGFVMKEQIFVHSQDLSYIVIDSDDVTVPVDRSAITVTPTSEVYKPLFFGNQCATLPIIDCLFEFDSSGVANGQSGVWVEAGSKVVMGPSGSGVKGSPGRGLHVSNNSIAYARVTNWDNSGLGLRVSNGSICQFRNASAQNCTNGAACEGSVLNLTNANFSGAIEQGVTTDGCAVFGWYVKAQNCGTIGYYPSGGTHDIKQGNFSTCGLDGIWASNAAIVNFLEGTATGCGRSGIRAFDGARVNARSATVSNASQFGIFATSACYIAARGANASNCNNGAFWSARGSFIDATEANGTHSTNNAFTVVSGGIIAANGATGRLAQKGNIILGSGVIFSDRVMSVSAAFVEKVFTPGEIYEQTITFAGIETSDQIAASINRNLQGCNMWSYVSAANTVKVFIKNEGATSVTINAGTITVKVI